MSGADGYEERTAEADEHYAEVMENLDLDEMRADEERHDAAAMHAIPTACIVNGHVWFTNRFNLTFCQRCGADQFEEVA